MTTTEYAMRSTRQSPEITLEDYKQAETELRVEEGRMGFFAHAIVYILVNILLIVINLVFAPAVLWFFYPLITWGIGLFMHYLYEVRFIRRTTEEREAKIEYRARKNLLRGANID